MRTRMTPPTVSVARITNMRGGVASGFGSKGGAGVGLELLARIGRSANLQVRRGGRDRLGGLKGMLDVLGKLSEETPCTGFIADTKGAHHSKVSRVNRRLELLCARYTHRRAQVPHRAYTMMQNGRGKGGV